MMNCRFSCNRFLSDLCGRFLMQAKKSHLSFQQISSASSLQQNKRWKAEKIEADERECLSRFDFVRDRY